MGVQVTGCACAPMQVVTLTMAGATFKPKECKFKVQVPSASGKHAQAKTVAKTNMLDVSKYCSEIGLAREQVVQVPLT